MADAPTYLHKTRTERREAQKATKRTASFALLTLLVLGALSTVATTVFVHPGTEASDRSAALKAVVPPELYEMAAEGRLAADASILCYWPNVRNYADLKAEPYKNCTTPGEPMAIFRNVTIDGERPQVDDDCECIIIFSKTNVGELRINNEPIGDYIGSMMGTKSGMHFFIVKSALLKDPSKVTLKTPQAVY